MINSSGELIFLEIDLFILNLLTLMLFALMTFLGLAILFSLKSIMMKGCLYYQFTSPPLNYNAPPDPDHP